MSKNKERNVNYDMAGFRDIDKALFPIKSINTVVQLFRNQLEGLSDPDLALLSIVAGIIENSLTSRSNGALQVCEPVEQNNLPILEVKAVELLYNKFKSIMTNAVDQNKSKSFATRELVKKVSDVIWNSLTRSYYKDRAHLQSLYSYLSGSKLDCFGVAFAVVAGCQCLGYNDVHLALSEDHAWVVFGENGTETAEVTWHGKGNEDKRGQEIGKGVSARSWLYVNNKPVVCTRHMEVAALVSAINPSLNSTHDAYEVALLQQELLWLLYDLGHLKKYPMAIGNLGDLEEISATEGKVPCKLLFEEAIFSARNYYNNQHVYPYTYQGGYFYRNKMYEEAFESWANASDVIRLYNYSRDDEEIYKEFLEIANELIFRLPVNIVCDKSEEDKILKKNGTYFNNNNYEKENGSTNNDHSIPSTAKPTAEVDKSPFHPSIEALTAACSEKILNPEYLLQGDGSPFVGGDYPDPAPINTPSESEEKINGRPSTSKQDPLGSPSSSTEEPPPQDTRPTIVLHSQKMKQLKDLLLAEKLNTQAISLHLTAQSQVQIGKKGRGDGDNIRPKRARRE
uniref:Menin n=1 Tax=Diabrotica virgifera virgifera TaxID=50390 RepID=A0A6P7F8Q7_DIAVI